MFAGLCLKQALISELLDAMGARSVEQKVKKKKGKRRRRTKERWQRRRRRKRINENFALKEGN